MTILFINTSITTITCYTPVTSPHIPHPTSAPPPSYLTSTITCPHFTPPPAYTFGSPKRTVIFGKEVYGRCTGTEDSWISPVDKQCDPNIVIKRSAYVCVCVCVCVCMCVVCLCVCVNVWHVCGMCVACVWHVCVHV